MLKLNPQPTSSKKRTPNQGLSPFAKTFHVARCVHFLRPIIYFLILLPFLVGSANTAEKETITWANLHFPPWMILEGESKGKGVWDELLQEVITKLPEYNHRTVTMKNVRFNLLAERKEKVCKIYYYKTPKRENFLHYSMPSVVFLSTHIVMEKEKAEILGNPISISLDGLMKDSRFKGTVVKGRSYGKVIDPIIAANLKQKQLKAEVLDYKSLVEFINLKRTDYILELPVAMSFFVKDSDLKPDVVNIAIDESTPYNITYVVCVKNEWGREVINRVDDILKAYIPTQAHRDATLRWSSSHDKRRLVEFYQQLLLYPIQTQQQR